MKDETEFAWSNKRLGIRQKHCRACMSKFNKASYRKADKGRIYDNRKKRREKARQYVWDYLASHPCVECGEADPRLLEFDHVRGKKRAPISVLANGRYSIETIQKEIDKCEVRCVASHRKKTYDDRDWYIG
ncbi:MAG TPA: hypothetical protein ENK32_03940 [Anaerolineae bacterium]|nr:hypothetical protein [Anaerolineae bacterium]